MDGGAVVRGLAPSNRASCPRSSGGDPLSLTAGAGPLRPQGLRQAQSPSGTGQRHRRQPSVEPFEPCSRASQSVGFRRLGGPSALPGLRRRPGDHHRGDRRGSHLHPASTWDRPGREASPCVGKRGTRAGTSGGSRGRLVDGRATVRTPGRHRDRLSATHGQLRIPAASRAVNRREDKGSPAAAGPLTPPHVGAGPTVPVAVASVTAELLAECRDRFDDDFRVDETWESRTSHMYALSARDGREFVAKVSKPDRAPWTPETSAAYEALDKQLTLQGIETIQSVGYLPRARALVMDRYRGLDVATLLASDSLDPHSKRALVARCAGQLRKFHLAVAGGAASGPTTQDTARRLRAPDHSPAGEANEVGPHCRLRRARRGLLGLWRLQLLPRRRRHTPCRRPPDSVRGAHCGARGRLARPERDGSPAVVGRVATRATRPRLRRLLARARSGRAEGGVAAQPNRPGAVLAAARPWGPAPSPLCPGGQ